MTRCAADGGRERRLQFRGWRTAAGRGPARRPPPPPAGPFGAGSGGCAVPRPTAAARAPCGTGQGGGGGSSGVRGHSRGLWGAVGRRGAAPGSVAAASARAASEDPERRRRCPRTARPAGAGLCPALPCGRALSPPGPLPGSAARDTGASSRSQLGAFCRRASPGASWLRSRARRVPGGDRGLARVCLPVCPFSFSHASSPQRTAARERTGLRRRPVCGIAFLVLNFSACYLFTDFKNRLGCCKDCLYFVRCRNY